MLTGEAGIVIIGDEILSGKHQDKHMAQVIRALKSVGWQLAWAQYLGDDRDSLACNSRSISARAVLFFISVGLGQRLMIVPDRP